MEDKYFTFSDHHGFEYFDTEQESIDNGNTLIRDCIDNDEWTDSINDIVVGVVTHRVELVYDGRGIVMKSNLIKVD